MIIESVQNSLIKEAADLKRKKHRSVRKNFLAEGLRTVEEALNYGNIEMIFHTEARNERTQAALLSASAKGIRAFCVSEKVLSKISDTESPQGIIAVCRMQESIFPALLSTGKPLLVLDRVSDPGNVGTIIRAADASGMGGLILLRGCADIFSPKTVRSSMGSIFHLPVLQSVDEYTLFSELHTAGYKVLAAGTDAAQDLYSADLSGKVAVILGNEANGVSNFIRQKADSRVFIPMTGRAESLNVAIAASVIMFEIMRRKI